MLIEVNNFSALKTLKTEIKNFNIFIGQQASGKSTISKLIYYFLNIRDEVKEYIIEILQSNISNKDLRRNLDKKLKKRFVEFFGPSIYEVDMFIGFFYNEKMKIEITTNKRDRKYIEMSISETLYGLVYEIIRLNQEKFRKNYSQVKLFSNDKSTYTGLEIEKIQNEITKKLNSHFGFDYDLLFIPAGRSILSTLSDQLQNIHPHLLDFPMRSFIEKVTNTKAFFQKNIDTIIKDKQEFETSKLWFSKINKTKKYIKKILKGQYQYDESGGRIVLDSNRYVKINYSSSGQQESVWIVLSLFLLILDNVNAMVFIEEPEAHLFPDAQKDIVEFILLVRNIEDTNFFITTHSPYILSAINNALYANKILTKITEEFDKDLVLDFKNISVQKVNSGKLMNLLNNELNMIDVSEIDNCSSEINEIYNKLEDLEFSE